MLEQIKLAVTGLVAITLLVVGFLLGKAAYEPRPVVAQTVPHPQRLIAPGTLLAARVAPVANAAPATAIPPGEHATASATVHLAAHAAVPDAAAKAPAAEVKTCEQLLQCPAVTLNETLATDKTGQPDLIVQGADVDQASFTPLPQLLTPAYPWAAGLSYGSGHELGVFVDRDLGHLRLGAEAQQSAAGVGQRGGLEARVKVGWRF